MHRLILLLILQCEVKTEIKLLHMVCFSRFENKRLKETVSDLENSFTALNDQIKRMKSTEDVDKKTLNDLHNQLIGIDKSTSFHGSNPYILQYLS